MTVAAEPAKSAARTSLAWAPPAVLSFAVLAVTARAGGAYLPSTWGWSALGPLLAAAVGLVLLDRLELGRGDMAFVALFGALLLWTGVSVAWSDSVPRSVSELERDVVYLSTVVALLLLTPRRSAHALVGGVAAAATAICAFGLAMRLFPDRFGLELGSSYRLARPLGYWNSMGLLAAMGLLVALGVAASAVTRRARAAAAGSIPILLATLYFTFSRGSWAALAIGLAVAVAATRDRGRLLAHATVLAPLAVAEVWLCSSFDGLNDSSTTLAAAARDGHRLAPSLAALALVAASAPGLVDRRVRRLDVPRALSRALLLAGLLLVLSAAAVAVVRAGGPGAAWNRLGAEFGASGWSPSTKLDDRLFTPSGRGRSDYWRVAWAEASSHPWLGSGAGTFDLYWTQQRPLALGALNAHSLYLETLAELGPPGLVLLCAALVVPLAALRRARSRPLAPAAAAAYVAFLVAAGADWHWELPTVTLAALACGVAVVVFARPETSVRQGARRGRLAALLAIAVLAVGAFVVQIENNALDAGRAAVADGGYERAASDARRALRLAPWSPAPWSLLAAAQTGSGDLVGARSSLRRAVAKDPNDWRLWRELAQASSDAARRESLAEAARLNPLGAG